MNISDTQLLSLTAILFPIMVSLCTYAYQRFVPPSEQARFAHASSIVGAVVSGVEQACVVMSGPDKKSEAIRVINQLMQEAHLKVSPTLVDSLIEQAVYAINQASPAQTPTKSLPAVSK